MRIKLNDIIVLVDIIKSSTNNLIEQIIGKYENEAENYENVASLLLQLNVLKSSNDKIFINRDIDSPTNRSNFIKFLAHHLIQKCNAIQGDYYEFLSKFTYSKHLWIYKPTTKDKLLYGEVRNLLIELGLVDIHTDNTYIINESYSNYFSFAFPNRMLSPKQLAQIQKNQSNLGLQAELKIVEFERLELKKAGINIDIEHVSLINVSAGYDIKSWQKVNTESLDFIGKYIEVKAVSEHDWNFYWSINEIRTAEKLGNHYFLYLLPLVSKNKFDLNSMLVICNPFESVFCCEEEWNKEAQEYLFSKCKD